ncbi:exodeoxyribonuclease V subunit alpha [Acidihalobacter prosperus]|uniref:RecBCD enzyme subunit RecD n=1 Tax=Acidihalobacter prosperus TaxID=160660 RepID=A0A1A6C3R4_9GAMM|nr:exodeoxyribonuclease V subunit alpha [Acidihalobacter prosperus]OBS09185.1 Exodeoxyribonuclease V alpha chain [Acidihalobacter prosperus]
MSARETLQRAAALGLIRALDDHFARLIGELACDAPDGVLFAAALASRQTGEGDVCLHLADWAGLAPFEALPALRLPPLAEWRAMLAASPAVGADARVPLVLDGDALYLARYWAFETALAAALRARAEGWAEGVDRARLATGLSRLLGEDDAAADQRRAAALAVLRRLAVISGGPGTGKTRTVTAILALLLEQAPALRVALAAPTGKAAARLAESIQAAKRELPLDDAVRAAIPERTHTLHRLLGIVPGRSRPRRDANNPLHVDLLVIDEASMVDLPLLARALAALPSQARLILLGDRDQLASVEAGAVLADICGEGAAGYSPALCAALAETAGEAPAAASASPSPLADSVALLAHSYRFAQAGGIAALARAVNAGDADAALAEFDAGWTDLAQAPPAPLEPRLGERLDGALAELFEAAGPAEALAALGRLRILCALREGPFGVAEINALVERHVRRRFGVDTRKPWYRGRPVMVQGNDYALDLFNGDVGIAWPNESDHLRVYFEGADGGLKTVHPGRMPAHETVYAMTVHKSQGSEFDEVLLILPRQDARVLTRELLYTGITRARRRVELWAEPSILATAVARRVRRASGLRGRLW